MADSTYRSGEHLIQTAQTQCDCSNTMRLRKHNATTQIQCDCANTMRWGLFFLGDCQKSC